MCTATEVSRSFLSPGGDTAFYVEPQTLESREDGLFAVGRPTFAWLFDEADNARRLTTNTFMGVEVRGGEVVRLDPPPGVTHIGWVRTLHLGGNRWGFLIGEYDQASLAAGDLVRVVYAIRDGDAWDGLEELPVPEGGRLDFAPGGSLVLDPEGIELWTTMHERERGGIDVLLYRRMADGWRASVAAEDWVDAVDLTMTAEGVPFIALGGLDPARDAVLASIRTARVEPGSVATPTAAWTRLQTGTEDQRMASPVFVRGRTDVDLAWLRIGPGGSEAWVVLAAPEAIEASAILVDSAAVLLVGLSAGAEAGSAYLLSYHQAAPAGPDRLHVYRRGAHGYVLVGAITYPFQGPFAATQTASGDLLIIGPESSLDPMNPYVRSLVIRLRVSCT